MDEILDEKTYETRVVQYAPFSLRTAALLADILLFIMLSCGIYLLYSESPDYWTFVTINWWKIGLSVSLYFLYFEGSESQGTLGKQILQIRVLKENKLDINFTDAAKHYILSLLLFFGYFLLLTNDKYQTLADKLCHITIIRK
ncbi:MAG: RDD family protein [Sphingobacteriales bacterium]|nr:RDD family protein [Sphingobacteriales bacterium]